MNPLAIGTRGSALALWQAHHVRSALLARWDGLEVTLEIIRTPGDQPGDTPLYQMPDTGLFTRRIEQALMDGRVDLAVHSLKDLPTDMPAGLEIAAVSAREDPADALVAKDGLTLAGLPEGATVLTGSLRRRAQLLHRRPDLRVAPIRGNVPTRLRKLAESEAAATVMARAGLVRLGLEAQITERLDPAEFLPACGQGALAMQVRRDDGGARERVAPLNDPHARDAVSAERAFLADLQGGCQVPLGAYAEVTDGGASLRMIGMVSSLDGVRLLRSAGTVPLDAPDAPQRLGRQLANELRQAGAREILDEIAQARAEAER